MVRLTFTYETVTEESACDGDVADAGFYFPGGYYDSIRGENHDAIINDAQHGQYDQYMRACEALREIREHVGSVDHVECYGESIAVYPADGDVDYHTGEETRITAHVRADKRLIAAMARALRA